MCFLLAALGHMYVPEHYSAEKREIQVVEDQHLPTGLVLAAAMCQSQQCASRASVAAPQVTTPHLTTYLVSEQEGLQKRGS